MLDTALIRDIAESHLHEASEERTVDSFLTACRYLSLHPDQQSGRGKKKSASVLNKDGLEILALAHFSGYRKNDFPTPPKTVPDEAVSTVLEYAFEYSKDDIKRIKPEHQHAMSAEDCVGHILERYMDSILSNHGWAWCCGDFVKGTDFLYEDEFGQWVAVQIKNRDNSENSSSSAIRKGTAIKKWFRSYSKDTKKKRPSMTNWAALPEEMLGLGLSEDGFREYLKNYLLSRQVPSN